MSRSIVLLLTGAWMGLWAEAATTTEIYRIDSGSYVVLGGFVGTLATRLPSPSQTFLTVQFDFDRGTAQMRILGEDYRSQFQYFRDGILQGGQVVFSNLTQHPLYPMVTNLATVDYTVQLGDASIWVNGSLQSEPVCCDVPYAFVHTNVHAIILAGPPPDPVGVYRYQGFDPQAQLIVSGWLTITNRSNPIKGTWSLQGANEPTNIGPQLGQGTLLGNREGDELTIDLNPGWTDNNVFLSGTLTDGAFTGGWSYATIMGTVTNGTFVAEKKLFHLSSPLRDRDRFVFAIQLDEGIRCAIEYADSLTSAGWKELKQVTGTGNVLRVEDIKPPDARRFYRARILDDISEGQNPADGVPAQ